MRAVDMRRGTATVLFTDLVGSTELSVAHGEAFDDARRAHDALLRSTIQRYDGAVVKGTGDGVMATFDGVADGAAAARAVQQAIYRLNRRRGEPTLAIRVGLSVGDVSFEQGDCYGEAVVQAARLCALAEGDQVLATEVVRTLLGGTRTPGFADRGAMELKGLPDAVEVVEVLWERPSGSATPLPAGVARDHPTFVGRSTELRVLDEAFDAANQGRDRRVVLISGEPGVGKTTVAAQAIRVWFDAGAIVAMGHCDEDVRAPYRPFADALGHLVASAPEDVLQRHVDRHGSSLVPLVPALADRASGGVRSADLETERFQLFAAVGDLLTELGQDAPVVLFLDDLHWADAGTVSLLRSLATSTDPARLLVLGTLRSDELAPDHPMARALAAFRRVAGTSRVQLEGLERSDIVDLLARWTGDGGGDAAERLADDLFEETGGNAFFVTEVVRHLDGTGQLPGPTSAPRVGGTLVPDSIREVLAERVARLGSVADDVLAAAAVIGSEFTLSMVGAVTGTDDTKVLGLLEAAMASALVREVALSPGRFAFTHALVQHAILASLGPTRTAALHRRVAELLETEPGDDLPVAALAHHWLQATQVSDASRARDWAEQAGDAALGALAPDDAVVYYRQALLLHDQLHDDDLARRIDLLTKLGTAERQAGDPEHRDTLLKACRLARQSGDPVRLAEAALANNSGTFSTFQGIDTERVEMLEAAIAVGTDPRHRALLLGTLANELTYAGDFARRRELADAAVHAARSTGDTALLLRVANLVFYALWVPDTLEERLTLSHESMRLLTELDDPLARFWTATAHYLNLVQSGQVEAGEPMLAEITALADRFAQPALRWRALHTTATRLLLAGDPAAAEPFAREALEVGSGAGEPEAVVYFKSQEMCLHWQRGTLRELSAQIRGTAPRPANAVAALCLIFTEAGRDDEAATLLDGAADLGFADLPYDPAFIAGAALFAEASAHLGHARSAALLYELLRPFSDQVGFDGVMTVGALEHHLGGLAGVLGRHDEAVARLERGRDLHVSIGARFFEAQSRHRLAMALLARGAPSDRAAARDELRVAIGLADAQGYAGVRRQARDLLQTIDS
jgi:class 3 adenylate cyclase